ncbi:hypothetical protein HK405_006335, partial [Cladochytrium tenue]
DVDSGLRAAHGPPIIVASTRQAPLQVRVAGPRLAAHGRTERDGMHLTAHATESNGQPTLNIEVGPRREPANARRRRRDVDGYGHSAFGDGRLDGVDGTGLLEGRGSSRPVLRGRRGLVRGGKMDPVEALMHPITMTRPSPGLARQASRHSSSRPSPLTFLVQLKAAVDALLEGKMPTNDQLKALLL